MSGDDDKRSLRLMIRMSPKERARLVEMARHAGLSLSAFIRHGWTGSAKRFRGKRPSPDNDSGPPSSGAGK